MNTADELQILRAQNAALQAELVRYRSMVNASVDVMTLLSADGTIMFESPSLLDLAGFEPCELEGQSVFDWIHPDDIPEVKDAFQRVLRHGPPKGIEYRWRTKNGGWLWVESRGVNLLDDPNVQAIVVTTRDISKRKEAQALAQHVIHGAQCILWHSPVEEIDGEFVWDLKIADPEAAHRMLNLPMPPEGSYRSVLHLSRLPEDRERAAQISTHALRNGFREYNQEFRCRRVDGSIAWLHENVSIERVGPKKWSLVGVCTDITANKMAEERWQQIVGSANCLLWYASVRQENGHFNWDIQLPDEAAAQRFLPLDVAPGQTYVDAWMRSRMPEDEVHMYQRATTALSAGEPGYTQEYRCRRVDGEVRWYRENVQISTLTQGEWQLVGVCIDVTEEKRAEAQLLEAHAELEERVAKRTEQLAATNRALEAENVERNIAMSALQEAVEALEQANINAERAREDAERARAEADRASLAKSEFLSRMSHELRTPLNAILGFSQVLQMDVAQLQPRHDQSISQILHAGRHLLELINEVLDLTRVEAGRMDMSPEPVNLKEIVEEAMSLVRPLASGANIVLQSEISALDCRFVQADRQRLRQVLLNLLSNAIKYNRLGGQVMLSCEPLPDHRVQIRVTDTGPGIAPDDMERLFVPFERLSGHLSDVEGTGLGLALSQRLAELMNGEMGVESTLGQGSTFWLSLPVAEEPRVQAASQLDEALLEVPSQPQPAFTVLTIEDNPANFLLVEAILETRPNIRLLQAMQGSIGLELAQRHVPHLILLDLHLPDIQGDEVLQRLRQLPTTRDIPVIVVSADATAPRIQRLLAAGARAYLTKPLNVREFLEQVDAALQETPISSG
jgi:PAS domain S-box-containing protein